MISIINFFGYLVLRQTCVNSMYCNYMLCNYSVFIHFLWEFSCWGTTILDPDISRPSSCPGISAETAETLSVPESAIAEQRISMPELKTLLYSKSALVFDPTVVGTPRQWLHRSRCHTPTVHTVFHIIMLEQIPHEVGPSPIKNIVCKHRNVFQQNNHLSIPHYQPLFSIISHNEASWWWHAFPRELRLGDPAAHPRDPLSGPHGLLGRVGAQTNPLICGFNWFYNVGKQMTYRSCWVCRIVELAISPSKMGG